MKPVRHCDADDVLMLLFLSANVIFLFPRNLPCVLFDESNFFLCFPLTSFSDRFRHRGKSSEKFTLFSLVFIRFRESSCIFAFSYSAILVPRATRLNL